MGKRLKSCACGCGELTTGMYRPKHRPIKHYRTVADGRRLHRVRAEKAFGRPLPPYAVVHHVDGTISEYSQLVICQDQAYHAVLHARMRVQKRGGNPDEQMYCGVCRSLKPINEMSICGGKRTERCKACTAVNASRCYRAKRSGKPKRRIGTVHPRDGKWFAKRGNKWLGTFATREDAEAAIDNFRPNTPYSIHGDVAIVNDRDFS